MEGKKGILLESGTNELEIVEFGIGQNKFGINVIKVRELLILSLYAGSECPFTCPGYYRIAW